MMNVLQSFNYFYVPKHVKPSPSNPVLHSQTKLPFRFWQTASLWQIEFSNSHSFKSIKSKIFNKSNS